MATLAILKDLNVGTRMVHGLSGGQSETNSWHHHLNWQSDKESSNARVSYKTRLSRFKT